MKQYILLLFIFLTFSKQYAQQDYWWMQNSNDSIVTTDFNKALHRIVSQKKITAQPITVAILDSDFNLNISGIQNKLWVNTKEIPDNGIDDDKNGYIDDIHGWNFLGRKDNKQMLTYTHVSATRILKKYDSIALTKLHEKGKISYTYSDVKESYDGGRKRMKKQYTKYSQIDQAYNDYMPKFRERMPNATDEITSASLKKLKITDSTLNIYRNYIAGLLDQGFPPDLIRKRKELYKNLSTICYDMSGDYRSLIGDDSDDIKDTDYGSSVFGSSTDVLVHGTRMAGTLVKLFDADTTKILQNNIKIMPVTICGYGNYADKDLALGIRYAVDNGAKVINISQSKDFSLHSDFIYDAISYADKHDVLIVSSAGNDKENLEDSLLRYPNDTSIDINKEFVSNYMTIGASNKHKNELKNKSSNYGINTVDLFAIGQEITTLSPNNEEDTKSGTSYSSIITAGIAAFIRSHFPNLAASEVKQLLMESGVEYTIPVKVPTKEDKERTIPFNELSKSGKIVNAYNALLMAAKMSKGRK